MDQTAADYYARHRLDRFVGADQIDRFRIRRFDRGQSICELEQPIDGLFFFVEGRARVFLPAENGRQLLLCYYQPLQLFGDLELFEQAPLATTTVEALTPCVCLALEREYVTGQLATDPLFLRQLCLSLGRKLSRVIRNSAMNLLHPLEDRVASYILATAAPGPDGRLVFAGNLTQIAELLGTSFRHLHRTLRSFCDQGILAKHNTSYTVQHPIELERRAAGVYVIT
ncbi:MAG TPA: cyclic nucleotide-binding domain-containing protein [Roseiflexaceae bacterium]|nr:cyclic nucleotide-binding domain-containing protein [Roseiflexaceae bacterium]